MTKYVLLLERVAVGLDFRISATCAIVGPPTNDYGLSKIFQNASELGEALNHARVADFEMNNALRAARNSDKFFSYITHDQAMSMGLLVPISE